MKIDSKIIFIVITLLIISCSASKVSYNKDVLIGVFIGDKSKKRLVLKPNQKFVYLAPEGSLFDESNAIDTLSYGKWVIDGNLLVLNSSEEILGQYVDIKVKELKIPNQDSIIVEIDCPFERMLSKNIFTPNRESFFQLRPYYYSIIFNTNNTGFSASSGYKRGGRIIKYSITNKLTKTVGDLQINSFSVTIIPDNFNFSGHVAYKLIHTGYYIVNEKSSNYFKISIPDFTSKYLNYKRLKGEYIKVIKNNQLIWNNEIFKKE